MNLYSVECNATQDHVSVLKCVNAFLAEGSHELSFVFMHHNTTLGSSLVH